VAKRPYRNQRRRAWRLEAEIARLAIVEVVLRGLVSHKRLFKPEPERRKLRLGLSRGGRRHKRCGGGHADEEAAARERGQTNLCTKRTISEQDQI
jgi:hypothetical protein